jgi:uncharacterized protein involved in exopolysaccharide biosynthesis
MRPSRRWLYGACIFVFCFGLFTIVVSIGEDRFVAKAALFAADDFPSQPLDVPLTTRVPDRVLREVVETENLAVDPEFAAPQWNWIARAGMVFGWTDYSSHEDLARDHAVLSLRQAVTLHAASPENAELNARSASAAQQDSRHAALEIEVMSLNAAKAMRLANSIAQAIVDEQKRSADAQKEHRRAIADKVAGFANRLQIAKQNLADFRDAQNQEHLGDQTGSIPQQGSMAPQADSIIAPADVKSDMDLVSRAIAAGRTSSLTSLHFPTPDLDKLLAQYADLQQRYQKAKLTLGDKHPELAALDGQIQAAQKKIHIQWLKVADIANRNYHAAQARAAADAHVVSAALDGGQGDGGPDHAGTVMGRLQSDIDLAQHDYDRALLLQAKEEASAESQTNFRIAPAKIPLPPPYKPHGFIVGAAMMLGAMFGLGRTVTEERRSTRKSPILQKPAAAALLVIPRIQRDWLGDKLRLKPQLDIACREVLDRPHSAFSQAIENLLETEIELESRETVKALFISKEDGLGTTTIAVNVAQMAAKSGARVLLIEANQRSPVLASLISPNVGVDLIDLAGTQRIICQLRPRLSVIPLFDRETEEVLEARAQHCFKGIRKYFDFVVIDGGTFRRDDDEMLELVGSVNRVFHLTPEGIELQADRAAFQRRR